MDENSDHSVRSSGWSPTVLVDARLKDKFIFVAISLARAKVVAKAEFMLTPGPVARELKDWRLADDEPSSDGRCAPPTPPAPSPGVAPSQAAAGPCCPRGWGLAWSEATWDGGRSEFCWPAAVWDPGELDWLLAALRSSGLADKPHPWASGPVTLALSRDATAAKLFGGDLKLVCGMGRARFSMLMSCNISREGGEE